jgi:WD40 repeat protein
MFSMQGGRMARYSLILLALVGLESVADAQPASVPRTDARGDPLPKYAIARLGVPALCHDGPLQALAFSPDGKHIATVDGAALRLWDAATGKLIRCQREKHFEYLLGVTFSPDGRWVAVGGAHCATVYDAATGKRRDLFSVPPGFVCRGLQYSPDGTLLVARADGVRVCVWDVATGRRRIVIAHDEGTYVETVAITADGGTLLTAGGDGTLARWDLASGRLLSRSSLSLHFWARGIALTQDGSRLAGWLSPGVLSVRDLAAAKHLPSLPLPADLKPRVESLAAPEQRFRSSPERRYSFVRAVFSADGRHLATMYEDHWFVWHVPTGKLVRARWLGEEYRAGMVALAPDASALAFGDGALLRVVDLTTGRERGTAGRLPGAVGLAFFTPDGRVVTETRPEENRPRVDPLRVLWDIPTGACCGPPPGPPPSHDILAISGKGDVYAVGDERGALWLWETASGKRLCKLAGQVRQDATVRCRCVAFSPDGTRLAAILRISSLATNNNTDELHVWRVPTAEKLATLKCPANNFYPALTFTADNTTLVAAGTHESERTGELHGNLLTWTMRGEKPGVRDTQALARPEHVQVSADGRLLAVSGHHWDPRDCWLHVYERATSRLVWRKSAAHWGPVAFSRDGRTLLAVQERDVVVLDALTGTERQRLTGHQAAIKCLTPSPSGCALVTGSDDHTAIVWDLARATAPPVAPPRLWTDAELHQHWEQLAAADPAGAYPALIALAAAPDQAPAWLGQRLKPVPHPDRQAVAKHFMDLDDARFAVRQRAQAALAQLGEQLLPDVEQRLKQPLPLEAVRRLEQLRAQITPPETPIPETLQALRAVAALERLGTPAARKVLEALAAGAPGAPLTREAQAALRRRPGP